MTFMLLDATIVAVSPATVYRVLKQAGVLDRWNATPSRKGTGFVQPLRPHEHWHIDISYVNVAGTFYYLCSILDGATRFLVHRELRERMTTADAETVIQRPREQYPEERPRIISDNGPQFIARDFKQFIRLAGTLEAPHPDPPSTVVEVCRQPPQAVVEVAPLFPLPKRAHLGAEHLPCTASQGSDTSSRSA